jgi:hypothetical protein
MLAQQKLLRPRISFPKGESSFEQSYHSPCYQVTTDRIAVTIRIHAERDAGNGNDNNEEDREYSLQICYFFVTEALLDI